MKTAIIGGGVGGMLSALYERQRGNEVVLYEKESSLGGRLNFVSKDGFKIDKGPTIVLLPEMIYSILKEVGIQKDEVEMIRIDPLYKLQFPDGMEFFKWSHIEKQQQEIKKWFPGEEESFVHYLNEMKWRFEEGKEAFLDRDFVRKRDFFSPSNVQTLWKLKAYQTVKKQASRYFINPRLVEAFSFQTLYIGGAPNKSPALYSLVPFSEHHHGIWYVKGGYASLVSLFEEKLRAKGVEIKLSSEVSELVTDGTRCTGVRAGDNLDKVDRVIVNGDFPLAEKLVTSKQKSYTPSSGCLLLYFGLSRKYSESSVHQFLMTEDFETHMNEVFEKKTLPASPSMYVFHPSLIDDSLAPKNKGVMYVLIPVPSNGNVDWDLIDDYVDERIKELEERAFPNLREAIEWMEVRTPKDAMQDGLYAGGSFGIAPTLMQSGVFRPQLKPFQYENVYAVGASTHPGGGIPIVMQGAKLLNEYIETEELVQSW
ncbi:phytoene desaturase family protein [Alkalihalophilus marmarensis]|uniref:Capsular polysaccharide biosynthesis protein CpsH n=1 Tax=Alkalihalophilus marmarensis DSM 21297 TaxID=1188261 RepID=U6SS92_9BACI|nr:phytoene desaturase family protein [Alkalihalophilus marmarensis]ERN54478.1 capsular polysaccharide biosynthesis protein CpsH [Alkalihalophilus marmarensis DSM 21297]